MKAKRLIPLKEQKVNIAKAFEFGDIAFKNGVKSAPFYDIDFNKWRISLNLPVCREMNQILEAWNNGWHRANLAAPIE